MKWWTIVNAILGFLPTIVKMIKDLIEMIKNSPDEKKALLEAELKYAIRKKDKEAISKLCELHGRCEKKD